MPKHHSPPPKLDSRPSWGVWLHQPLIESGFSAYKNYWAVRGGPIQPMVALQRDPKYSFDGEIRFTICWGLWCEPNARRFLTAKRRSRCIFSAMLTHRIGELLGHDTWWTVRAEDVVRDPVMGIARREPAPSPNDDVPSLMRRRVTPLWSGLTTPHAVLAALPQLVPSATRWLGPDLKEIDLVAFFTDMAEHG
jgi:hypothetical protein